MSSVQAGMKPLALLILLACGAQEPAPDSGAAVTSSALPAASPCGGLTQALTCLYAWRSCTHECNDFHKTPTLAFDDAAYGGNPKCTCD